MVTTQLFQALRDHECFCRIQEALLSLMLPLAIVLQQVIIKNNNMNM